MTYLLGVVGLLLLFFLALGARSLKSFSRHKLEDFCKQRNAEEKLKMIIKNYDSVAGAVTIVRMLFFALFMSVVVLRIQSKEPNEYDGLASPVFWGWLIGLLFAVFYFPRVIARIWGTGFVYYTWGFWNFLATLAYPFTLIDSIVSTFFHRLADVPETNDEDDFEEEIRTMVSEGHREGLLEDEAREMIEGVMELRDATVSEVMTPRTDMRCIPDSLTWDEMLQFMTTTSHSRIPVYKETRDDIVGILHIKNLLKELARPDQTQRRPWTDILTAPLFVPETKQIDTLLKEFQNIKTGISNNINSGSENPDEDSSAILPHDDKAKGHLAIVLDEYGGVAGIVTLEDLLEEIVGEITDEHETVVIQQDITPLADDVFDVLGRVRIDAVNDQLGLHLPEEEDYDTVAGFIFSTLGHIPDVGETVTFEHDGKKVLFTVTEATRRRIEKVRIER